MATKVVLVDFENIQNLDGVDKIINYEVKVFVGMNQSKVSLDLVLQTQKLGKSLEWIKVSGQGKNALDFHIAYYVGRYFESKKFEQFVIVSKDTGYDPLIEHINSVSGSKMVYRVTNINQITHKNNSKPVSPEMKKIVDQLKKIQGNKRPKKRSTLTGFVKSCFANQKTSDEINELIERLYSEKFISEANGLIKYDI